MRIARWPLVLIALHVYASATSHRLHAGAHVQLDLARYCMLEISDDIHDFVLLDFPHHLSVDVVFRLVIVVGLLRNGDIGVQHAIFLKLYPLVHALRATVPLALEAVKVLEHPPDNLVAVVAPREVIVFGRGLSMMHGAFVALRALGIETDRLSVLDKPYVLRLVKRRLEVREEVGIQLQQYHAPVFSYFVDVSPIPHLFASIQGIVVPSNFHF
mmetsp:Transcript_24745/g.46226  ORF Transcript_24745/g.46226 Transcript_24745/m.46226 type:complete len:214 (+) Transcript_24745:43-684(+)